MEDLFNTWEWEKKRPNPSIEDRCNAVSSSLKIIHDYFLGVYDRNLNKSGRFIVKGEGMGFFNLYRAKIKEAEKDPLILKSFPITDYLKSLFHDEIPQKEEVVSSAVSWIYSFNQRKLHVARIRRDDSIHYFPSLYFSLENDDDSSNSEYDLEPILSNERTNLSRTFKKHVKQLKQLSSCMADEANNLNLLAKSCEIPYNYPMKVLSAYVFQASQDLETQLKDLNRDVNQFHF